MNSNPPTPNLKARAARSGRFTGLALRISVLAIALASCTALLFFVPRNHTTKARIELPSMSPTAGSDFSQRAPARGGVAEAAVAQTKPGIAGSSPGSAVGALLPQPTEYARKLVSSL